MVLGMSLSTFTTVHVVISLIGIVTGLVVLFAMLGSSRPGGWTALFLVTTLLTSATGFLFPFTAVTPGIVVGLLSLIVLALAIFALYSKNLTGPWRVIYLITALIAQWFNSFVGIVQAFQKLSFLNPLAPTGSEPPFLVAQIVVLAFYVVLGFLALRRFHPETQG